MSSGSPGGPSQNMDMQQQYNAMMAAADAFIAASQNVNLNQVNRQPTDCQRLEAIILAATSLYNTHCNV